MTNSNPALRFNRKSVNDVRDSGSYSIGGVNDIFVILGGHCLINIELRVADTTQDRSSAQLKVVVHGCHSCNRCIKGVWFSYD